MKSHAIIQSFNIDKEESEMRAPEPDMFQRSRFYHSSQPILKWSGVIFHIIFLAASVGSQPRFPILCGLKLFKVQLWNSIFKLCSGLKST